MFRRIDGATVTAVLIAAVSLMTTACLADIDATGRWVIRGPYVLGTYVVADDWAPTTSSGYSGTIAPTAAAFSMTRPVPPLCGTDTRTGTFSADGQSWIGTEHIHPSSSPTACLNGFEFPVTGSRCPNGSIEFGEACDDGNVIDGDGCGTLCALEACWSCTGEPSACAPLAACACPSGTLEAAEECDDGNSLDGDGGDDTCAIESCWSCAGAPSVCAALPFGSACDAGDGVACTTGGTCDGAQHCVETPTVALCDDGNACTLEACDPLVGCVHAPNPCDDGDPCTSDQCVTDCTHTPRVRTDCRTAALSRLLLKSSAAGDRDTLTWTWARGESTSQAEFADPRADAHYDFCVFAGAANATVGAAHVRPTRRAGSPARVDSRNGAPRRTATASPA